MATAGGNNKADFNLTIGLNMDDLFQGMSEADATINQAISRINSENKQVKLKADIAEIKAGNDELAKQKIKMDAVTREIELQTAKLKLLGQARDDAYREKGANSSLGRGAETRYLQQEKVVSKLNAELTALKTASTTAGNAAGGVFERIKSGAESAHAGVNKLTGTFGTLSGKMTAALGVIAVGGGLFNLTDSAMKAGESLYKLQSRLHLSTAEASQLSRVFKLCGSDVNSIVPYFARIDKQLLSAGENGNATSLALMKFGISLKDSSGSLLPINQQLAALAEGYKKAADAGAAEAFTAEVLGARGAALIPVLAQYGDAVQAANSVKTTGMLDPREAHELNLEWMKMQAELGQIKMAVGASLMPLSKELMPEITSAMSDFVSMIRDNKDGIKDSISGWAGGFKDLLGVIKTTGSALNTLRGKDVGSYGAINDELEKDNTPLWATRGLAKWGGAAVGGFLGSRLGVTGAIAGAYAGGSLGERGADQMYWGLMNTVDPLVAGNRIKSNYASKLAEQGAEKRLINNGLQTILGKSGWTKAFEDVTGTTVSTTFALEKNTKANKDNAAAANDNATAQQTASEAMKQRETAAGQLSEKIYALTHNDIENATHAMYVEAEKAKANGVSDDLVSQFVGAQSARIAEDKFRNVTAPIAQAFKTDLQNQLDSIDLQAKSYIKAGASASDAQAWAAQRKTQINADWDREVAAQIDSIWKTSFQNRLDEIEREKQAWIKKGLDEVKATQWAEEKKKQTVQEAAQAMFTSEKKYYDVWKKAGGMASGQTGIDAIAQQMRKDKGIPDGAFTTPGEIGAFEAAMKAAQSELVPIISDGTYQGVKAAMVEVMHGTSTSQVLPQEQQEQLFGGGRINTMRGGNAAYDNYDTGFNSTAYHAWTEADALKLAQLGGLMNDAQWGGVPQQQAQSVQQAAPINVNITANLQGSITPDNAVDELSERVAKKVDESMQEARRQIQNGISNTY
jgi:hypothetical protein